MATFIQSEPSMNGTTLPTNAGELIRSAEWGIDNTLTGFIVQSEDIAEEVIKDQTQDQKGAIVSELDYDKHWTLSLTIIGDTEAEETLPKAGDMSFQYGGHTWKITNVTYTGSYNAKKQWKISAERWTNFPAQVGG